MTSSDALPKEWSQRISWDELPFRIREIVQAKLGARVVGASTQIGGFSAGVASRLVLANGDKFFLKAVCSEPNPDTPSLFRREIKIASALPSSTPAPRFVWSYDDGEWITLAFEDIDGKYPKIPWMREELDRVLSTISELTAQLTPSPISTAPSIQQTFRESFKGWRHFEEYHNKPAADSRLLSLDDWTKRNLSRLVELEKQWEEAAKGSTLLHCDLRADNILLTRSKVYIHDWPWASVGAPWIDLLFFLPSLAMQGGPKPWEVFDHHELSRNVGKADVDSLLAALAGLFLWLSAQPSPPGLPNLRRFQKAQGEAALEWLKIRTEWD